MKRVLMVDPDFESVAHVRQAFMAWDEAVEFDHVDTADQAMEYLKGSDANPAGLKPHLLMTELDLPDRDGLEMLQHIKGDADLNKIPIAVYTGTQDSELISSAYTLKVSCCIPKPADPAQVPALVKDLQHFFLTQTGKKKINPLLEVLNNPAKKKKASEAFAAVGKTAELDAANDGKERREHKRAQAGLTVRTRVYSAVEVGKIIMALSQPEPNLSELVTLEGEQKAMHMACMDISAGGVGAETHPALLGNNSLDRGDHLAMLIDMPEGPTPIRAVGQVMWSKREGSSLHRAGLMFLAISPGDRERIIRFVAQGQEA